MGKTLAIPADALPEIEDALAKEHNARAVRWLLGIRLVAMKRTCPQAAAELNVSDREVRRWTRRFLDGGIEAMRPRSSPGAPPHLAVEDEERFKERIRQGPTPEDGFSTWRGPFVREMLAREFGAHYRGTSVYDLLHRLGFSSLVPRPQHPGSDPEKQEEFKKNVARSLRKGLCRPSGRNGRTLVPGRGALRATRHPDARLGPTRKSSARASADGL